MWSYADSFAAHAGDHAKPINVHAEPDGCDYPGVLRRNPVQAYQCTTQGELIRGTSPLPYLWVAASGRGTVVRINTDTGVIEGEYRTGATRHLTSSCGQEGAA